MRLLVSALTLLALLVPAISVPAGAADAERSYLVVASGNGLPANLSQQVTSAGGTITATIPEIGVAVVTSSNGSFTQKAAKIKGVKSVVPDIALQGIDKRTESAAFATMGVTDAQLNNAITDPFFEAQWALTAVGAPAAWEAGHRGAGVRVAVLDDGIHPTHLDLAPNLNVALSTSFIPGESFEHVLNFPGEIISHGSHVAGIIAADDNGYGTIGVAPDAEIVMVKVASAATGIAPTSSIVQGIIYAANIDADVISMSIAGFDLRGGYCDFFGCLTAKDVAETINIVARATSYAYQQGSTVIASAGNDGLNTNTDNGQVGLPGLVISPASNPHVIAISATGPLGWALDPETDLNVPAFYTNHGLSLVDFAAPGGNWDFDLTDSGAVCEVANVVQPCFFFDWILSTGAPGFGYWELGTSMAAPYASGVAALIIGMNGGEMHPAQVEAAMRSYALDLGKKGKDQFYGKGLVNVAGLTE